MAEVIRNVIRFSDAAPEDKLQELLSAILSSDEEGGIRFVPRTLVTMPEDPALREMLQDACNNVRDTAYSAHARELDFSMKLISPKDILEKLAEMFPEVDFVWYGVDEDCSKYGYGVAVGGVFQVDVPNAPSPVDVCRVCYNGCTWSTGGKDYPFQCGNCPRF